MMDKMERMEFFDFTKPAEIKTRGAYDRSTIKMEEGGMMIARRNVGESEPDLTDQQKKGLPSRR